MDKEYFASINDVSKRLDVPAYTLRYWEKQFPTIIRPTTGAGGRRYYRPETVNRLFVIKDLLYKHGITIAGVKKLLRDGKLPESLDDLTIETGRSVMPDVATVAAPANDGSPVDFSPEINAAIKLLESARDLLK